MLNMETDFTGATIYSNDYVDRKGFECIRCGRCCTELSDGRVFTVDENQYNQWKEHCPNVLPWLAKLGELDLYDGWIHPDTGEDADKCPWHRFRKHQGSSCLIHNHKPPVCKLFPHTVSHAVLCKCPGFTKLPQKEIIERVQKEIDLHNLDLQNHVNNKNATGYLIRSIDHCVKALEIIKNGKYVEPLLYSVSDE